MKIFHFSEGGLCVGLDPDESRIPTSVLGNSPNERMLNFTRMIVDATAEFAGAFKPNAAFFESHGAEGWSTLKELIAYIHRQAPGVPVILDAKRGDIGNSSKEYAKAIYDALEADAVTLSPYMGLDSLLPFLERSNKLAFVLCRTSNSGAGELQELEIAGEPLYLRIARRAAEEWSQHGEVGLVVGATAPEEIARVRQVAPELPLLIPGVGAQVGDLEASVRAAQGTGGFLVSCSRGILFASSGEDFVEAARREAERLRRTIREEHEM